MRKTLSLSMIAFFATSSIALAASGDAVVSTGSATQASGSQMMVTSAPTPQVMPPDMSAAPNPTVAAPMNTNVKPKMGTAIGEYKTVSCSSNSLFGTNSCDQCFDGGSVKVGERLTGLFDNWTNATSGVFIAYKDEQKTPNMVRFGNTVWTATPTDEAKLWKDSSDIVWTKVSTGTTKMQYFLPPGTTVKFKEADLGAGYTLTKTDKKNGEIVGMLKFPVVYRTTDAVGNEGAAKTHYECATYTLSAPPATGTGQVVPPEVTKTKTGPETLLLIVAAFFIAFGMMFSLRKRS